MEKIDFSILKLLQVPNLRHPQLSIKDAFLELKDGKYPNSTADLFYCYQTSKLLAQRK